MGGDFNVAPADADVWDPAACHGGTHVSPPERQAFAASARWGLVDAYRQQHAEPERYTWWDYRAGNFHKNFGMRIDHLLVTQPVAERVVWAEIDREARKGKPIPSDHAPLVIDLDEPGRADRRRLGRRRGAHRGPPHALNGRRTRDAADDDLVNGAAAGVGAHAGDDAGGVVAVPGPRSGWRHGRRRRPGAQLDRQSILGLRRHRDIGGGDRDGLEDRFR